jgi:methyl-accepting chemotaxis protein
MSEVSIDKLTIDIETNAVQAEDGIKKLATALGTLKQNGSFGTAVKNLNNLADSLKKLTPVTSNANKLSALATSVDQLSKAGSFARVVNQLNKLPDALKGLSSLNIDNDLGVKLEKLAKATTPLSNIKTGGLGTMVNALDKIGDVTAKLDDGTIDRFARRVEKLSDKLTPLSSKMTTIQSGLRGINSSARSAGSGIKELGSDVNATTLNLSSMINIIRGVKDAIMPLVHKVSQAVSQAIEWMVSLLVSVEVSEIRLKRCTPGYSV